MNNHQKQIIMDSFHNELEKIAAPWGGVAGMVRGAVKMFGRGGSIASKATRYVMKGGKAARGTVAAEGLAHTRRMRQGISSLTSAEKGAVAARYAKKGRFQRSSGLIEKNLNLQGPGGTIRKRVSASTKKVYRRGGRDITRQQEAGRRLAYIKSRRSTYIRGGKETNIASRREQLFERIKKRRPAAVVGRIAKRTAATAGTVGAIGGGGMLYGGLTMDPSSNIYRR